MRLIPSKHRIFDYFTTSLFQVLIRRLAHKALCNDANINQALKTAIPAPKTRCLKMRVQSKHLSCSTSQTMSGKRILDRHDKSFIIIKNISSFSVSCLISVIAHAQNVLVMLFNATVYPTPLIPIEISISLSVFILTEVFTRSIFIQIGL